MLQRMGLFKKFPAIDRAIDRLGYWSWFFTAVWGVMTWLFGKLGFIAAYGWPAAVLAGIAATCVIAVVVSLFLVAWRYFRPPGSAGSLPNEEIVLPTKGTPFDPDIYSHDPSKTAPDRPSYFALFGFAANYVLPACDNQIALQKALIARAARENQQIKDFAIDGFYKDTRKPNKQFWDNYNILVFGIDSSEPTITFKAMINALNGLERYAYFGFCAQSASLAVTKDNVYIDDEEIVPLFDQWTKSHNLLIDEFDRNIKTNLIFGKLYRRQRASRWGPRHPSAKLSAAIEN